MRVVFKLLRRWRGKETAEEREAARLQRDKLQNAKAEEEIKHSHWV